MTETDFLSRREEANERAAHDRRRRAFGFVDALPTGRRRWRYYVAAALDDNPSPLGPALVADTGRAWTRRGAANRLHRATARLKGHDFLLGRLLLARAATFTAALVLTGVGIADHLRGHPRDAVAVATWAAVGAYWVLLVASKVVTRRRRR